MKRRDIRKFLIKELKDNIRSYIISEILKQDLEKIKSEYREKHSTELSIEKEALFMEWELSKASSEADSMIETSVDEFIASKFRWLPFRNITVIGLCIIPAIMALTLYGLRHFSYLMGNEGAFTGLGYDGLTGTIFSIVMLSLTVISSFLDEFRKE